MNTKTAFTGSILAALFASLCCIGPIAFAGLGVTSVALGAKFEPLRPVGAADAAGGPIRITGCADAWAERESVRFRYRWSTDLQAGHNRTRQLKPERIQMTSRKIATVVASGLVVFWGLATAPTIAQAQVLEARVRIDGMT